MFRVVLFATFAAAAFPNSCGIHTIMTVVFENQNFAKVMKDPYFGRELTRKGLLLTNFYAEMHPSQPNYLAMISGSTHRVFYDFNVDIEATTIVDLLEPKQLTWKSYQEAYPGNCYIGSSYETYVRKHNPFMSFNNIRTNETRCANIVAASELDKDAKDGNLPNYIFYTPDMNNCGHDTTVGYASNWLEKFLEPKLGSPDYRYTLFFITFDESETYVEGNHIYSLLIGAGVPDPGTVDDNQYNHYSFLATVESLFDLGNLERGDKYAKPIPLKC